MTVPVHPLRRGGRDRRFDLRATALFFLLLAILLCVLAFVARTAAGIAERRPLWAGALLMSGVAVAVLCRSGRRRFSAAAYARRAARALEEAAETASTSLSVAAADAPVAAPAGTGVAADLPTPAAPAASGRGEEYLPAESTRALTVPLHPGTEERTEWLGVIDYAELDPDGFEQAIADLCVRDACRDVVVEGGPGDLGADVRAVTPDGRRVIIQCKQYCETNKVGSQDMQRFGGTCFTVHEADVAAVVTTSDFTEPALEYARQCGIVCVNGPELRAWTDGTGPSPWERAGIAP